MRLPEEESFTSCDSGWRHASGCGCKALPLGLLCVARDEVVVHVEEADPQQVEDDVEPVAQSHRLVVGLPEGREGALLWAQWNGSVTLIQRGNNDSDFTLDL